MTTLPPKHVAIIGAGPGGLALALALHAQSISCAIYEQRLRSLKIGGAIILAPNALRVLDALGLYDKIRMMGFNFENVTFKDESHATMNSFQFGNEHLYGFSALRISRQTLVHELLTAVEDRGIPVRFDAKYSNLISEDESGVSFQFIDGSIESATLLVGADGIHSKVRQCMYPSVKPVYSGQLAIISLVRRSMIRFPEGIDYPLPVVIYGTRGAFLIMPQDIGGESIHAGTQQAFPERDKLGWDSLASSKSELTELFNANLQWWPDVVKSCVEATTPENLTIWPYYFVPKLKHWTSEGGKVILLGDAAHAIPPTAAQGTCMALEDAYTLALVLSRPSTQLPLFKALAWWQNFRQERIDKVLELTTQLGSLRLSAAERAELALQTNQTQDDLIRAAGSDLQWLYSANLREEVLSWIEHNGR
ncbi:hypothetical protein V492_06241 [Pseudogymnoascus sp. VKM F-4246]|nr:hypothetical protein V492_06241 [Pseudogymnoascus sp. VKM F-4246]